MLIIRISLRWEICVDGSDRIESPSVIQQGSATVIRVVNVAITVTKDATGGFHSVFVNAVLTLAMYMYKHMYMHQSVAHSILTIEWFSCFCAGK